MAFGVAERVPHRISCGGQSGLHMTLGGAGRSGRGSRLSITRFRVQFRVASLLFLYGVGGQSGRLAAPAEKLFVKL